jgi:hypothetical protein
MDALGRLFDISPGIVNVDMNTAGATGTRVSLQRAGGCTVVALVGAAGSGTETLTLTLKQHTASASGTTADLVAVSQFWVKGATALLGSETWTRVTQTAAATVALTDTIAGLTAAAQKQLLVAFEVNAASLADGYKYISVTVADPGSVARIASVLYLPRDLLVQRTPANLAAGLS